MSTLILRGGRVWNGIADTTTGASITIDGDRIEAVGAALGGPKELDVSGCTVVPGLIEGHAHLCFDATAGWRATYDSDTPGAMLARMAGNAQRMLAAGITTVRDLGAPTAPSIELRESIAQGLISGPRLLVSGAPITTTGGHCWFMGGECDGELGIRRAVRERVKAGVDWIKVMASAEQSILPLPVPAIISLRRRSSAMILARVATVPRPDVSFSLALCSGFLTNLCTLTMSASSESSE